MSLIWHIVCKDGRRLWLPLTLWLLLRVPYTALAFYTFAQGEMSAAEFTSLGYFAGVGGGIISAVGFILAAWLVMEDNLVSPSAFWPTRPISGFRLLTAKTVGALLFLSVLPVVVMVPIWAFCGFGAADIFKSAFALASPQAILSLAAFALACVTETSGQFLIRLIGGLFILVLGFSLLSRLSAPGNAIAPGLLESRGHLVMLLLLITSVVMVVYQFLHRRTICSWMLAGGGFLLILGVGVGWPWDFSEDYSKSFSAAGESAASSGRSINFKAGQTVMGKDYLQRGRTQIRLQGTVSGVPAGDYVRINFIRGGWGNGEDRLPLRGSFPTSYHSWFPPPETVRQVAGLSSGNGASVWTIDADEPDESLTRARAQNMTLPLELNATLMQGQIVGELPMRTGAELNKDVSCTRFIGVKHVNGRVVVVLNERLPSSSKGAKSVDSYLLLDRARAWDQIPMVDKTGSVVISSIMVGQRQLTVTPPTHEVDGHTEEIPDWEETAVIVKIRFQSERDFSTPLTIDPFATAVRQ